MCETAKLQCFVSSFSCVARICFPFPKHSAWQAFCFDFSRAFLPKGFYKYQCIHCLLLFLLLSIKVPARLKAKCKGREKLCVQFIPKGQLYHRLGTSLYSDAKVCQNKPSSTFLLLLVQKVLCSITESTRCQVKM